MDIDQARVQDLVERPSESLAVEVKNWISPDDPEGKAKIVRSSLALRNHGGGFLVIGFNDKSLLPENHNQPSDVRAVFHPEKIQNLVARHSSEPFEVGVGFGVRYEGEFPVIVIPSGVRTPVAVKAGGLPTINVDDVYVRTLRSNVPATSKVGWKDWPNLVETCFDNREADIGRFFRRHLAGGGSLELQQLLAGFAITSPSESLDHQAQQLLDLGKARQEALSKERGIELPSAGWWDASLVIDGVQSDHSANIEFLRLLDSNNPSLTGWPVWLVSSNFADRSMRPHTVDGVWEAFISDRRHGLQYMRYDPKGRFVQRSMLIDDVSPAERNPNSLFDFAFPIQDCAEAIAVGLAFARALGCSVPIAEVSTCNLQFAFRWSGLRGRELSSWAHPRRYIGHSRRAYQDEVTISLVVAADTPPSAIGGLLAPAIEPLFNAFDGFQLGPSIIEDIATRVINRQRV
ncbi:ATP-binding protein [Lysobacter sp. BMK333-48F3]|uniref:AlbA family DNA-binding domain-containing protein n=1 Tax=Lysobacter sp. BMK333-48F3 TaxID=2867962 RepID=UPI001C8B1997|nr:ATP-binding protein [Lysobacter sp. BMK333-48F3]MBX9402866.1 ATP-binding protein [Lysobacter sp. BMK333-48F3]